MMEVTYSKDRKLNKLAKSLPDMLMDVTEKVMRGRTNIVDKLCKRVYLIEGAVTTLKYNMHDLKGKVPMDDTEMAMLTKVMKSPKEHPWPNRCINEEHKD